MFQCQGDNLSNLKLLNRHSNEAKLINLRLGNIETHQVLRIALQRYTRDDCTHARLSTILLQIHLIPDSW